MSASAPGPFASETTVQQSGVRWRRALARVVAVQPDEIAAVAWSWLCSFSVLTAYYVLRPIRDDMGVAGGVQNLAWLFTGTLAGMVAGNAAFSWLAARMPRHRLVALGYRAFAVNLLLFFAFFTFISSTESVWAGRVFFVWTAVFNIFVVSMFWSVMTDAFTTAQGKRLFGFVGVGGQIGGITGAALTSTLVPVIGAARLMLISAVLLEVAAFAARRIFRTTALRGEAERLAAGPPAHAAGGALDGLRRTAADPYLRGIALHVVLFTVLTTFLYFQQAALVDARIVDRVARTRFFANIDLVVLVTTLIVQAFVTGPVMRLFGLTATLAFLPLLSVVGFATLAVVPAIGVLMVFQVARRSGEFGIARPAREVLFTVAARRDRYTAKNFIDTFVYRAGDQIGAWMYSLLLAAGLGLSGVSTVAVGLSVVSVGVAWWLGRSERAAEATTGPAWTEPVPTADEPVR